jgi:hypothetical protein
MKRCDIELLDSGVEIDWSTRVDATNPSASRNCQYKVKVKCATCQIWRFVNTCSIYQIRHGKQQSCSLCHRRNVNTKIGRDWYGRRRNKLGYIVRTLISFSIEELLIVRPMLRRAGKRNQTEILEHRAIVALFLGRPLEQGEIVHHINGIKDDNRIENLQLASENEHGRLHSEIRKSLQEAEERIRLLEIQLKEFSLERKKA